MNQGKLEVVKQEMSRVNVDTLGISKLKWTGMGEFNSDLTMVYKLFFPLVVFLNLIRLDDQKKRNSILEPDKFTKFNINIFYFMGI